MTAPRLRITGDAAAVVIIVLLWLRTVGGLTVLSFTVEKTLRSAGDETLTSAASSAVTQVTYIVLLAACAAAVVFNLNDVTRPGLWRIAFMLAPWLWLLVRNAYSGFATPDTLLYPFLVLALAALRPSVRTVLAACGILVIATAGIAIAMGLFAPEAGIAQVAPGEAHIRADKANLPDLGLLQGMFTTENSLAQFLAVGWAAVFAVRPWWLRIAGAGAVFFAVFWSSSRSGMATLVIMSVVGMAVALLVAYERRVWASVVARSAIAVGLLAMIAVPLIFGEDEAFTGRGEIWSVSLREWAERGPWFGLGNDWYAAMARSETSPLHAGAVHGHNDLVQVLVTGGIVMAAISICWLAGLGYALTRARARWIVPGSMLLVGVIVNGVLEVSLGFVDRSVLWVATVVPLAVLLFDPRRDVREGDTAWLPERRFERSGP